MVNTMESSLVSERERVALQLREAQLKLMLAKRSAAASGLTGCAAASSSSAGGSEAPAKRQRWVAAAAPSAASAHATVPIAQVTLGGSAYQVMPGGRSLRRTGSAQPPSVQEQALAMAVAAAEAAKLAAASATQRAAAAVAAAGGRPMTTKQPPRLPGAAAAASAAAGRHVSVPGAGFETTANGMGLKRRTDEAPSRPARTTVDFQRQRERDDARAAKSSVLCTYFCRHAH